MTSIPPRRPAAPFPASSSLSPSSSPPTSPSTSPARPSATVRSAASPRPDVVVREARDLLAVVPVMLGFWPHDCVVMTTVGAGRPFQARLDLVDALDPTGRLPRSYTEPLADRLLAPALRYGTTAVALVYYGEDPAVVGATHRHLVADLAAAGIEVSAVVAVRGGRYRHLDASGRGVGPDGPADVRDHPLVLQAVLDGRLNHESREQLVASIQPDPDAVAGIEAALCAAGLDCDQLPRLRLEMIVEGTWVERCVARCLADGEPPTEQEVARLLWAIQVPRLRDAAWASIARGTARRHVALWRDVVRAAPERLVAPAATLLGWAAWQAGDGALAWIAHDRAIAADPDHRLADLLGRLLAGALAPEEWTGGFDWAAGLR
ncbi:DUF4192 domain-containing protein [Nocardioides sp.]|uniref:DUF4192 domain-containing protein n=1 Tax=Nocardioides sp. TaxID=35761 RepID=UPI0035154D91